MQAKVLPVSYGWKWVIEGLHLWRKSPVTITMTAITMTLVILGTSLIPFIGQIALPVILAPLEVGMFMLCWKVDHTQAAPPTVLFSGFQRHLPQLAAIGIIRLAGNLLFLSIAISITGVDISRAVILLSGGGDAAVEFMHQYMMMMALFFILRIPVEMADWYAPLLVGLRSLPVLKALFFSFVACKRNAKALLMFLVALVVVFGIIPILLIGALGTVVPSLASALTAPVLAMIMPLFYAAYYKSAMDIFDNGF